MKYLPTIFLFLAVAAFGANYCVKFHADHEWLPDGYVGAVTNVGTNAKILAGWHTNWTDKQLAAHIESMRPQYEAALSNRNYIAAAPDRERTNTIRNAFKVMEDFESFASKSNVTATQIAVQLREVNKAMLTLRPLLERLYLENPQ